VRFPKPGTQELERSRRNSSDFKGATRIPQWRRRRIKTIAWAARPRIILKRVSAEGAAEKFVRRAALRDMPGDSPPRFLR
jgi:hypothetical protein